MLKALAAISAAIVVVGCASLSPASRIESELRGLGLSSARAECMADALADELERDDLEAIADFLEGISESDRAGDAIDTLRGIDNPRAAAAVAVAALKCALSS